MITRSVIKSKLTKKKGKNHSEKKILKPQHRLLWNTALNIFNRPLTQSTEWFCQGSFSHYNYS